MFRPLSAIFRGLYTVEYDVVVKQYAVNYTFVGCHYQIEIGECLLSFRAESLVFQFTIQKRKD
jgi:hypothetical protein